MNIIRAMIESGVTSYSKGFTKGGSLYIFCPWLQEMKCGFQRVQSEHGTMALYQLYPQGGAIYQV